MKSVKVFDFSKVTHDCNLIADYAVYVDFHIYVHCARQGTRGLRFCDLLLSDLVAQLVEQR